VGRKENSNYFRKMAKQSAGILLYRTQEGELQVMLVHPGGPFHKKRDAGAWSIPKGEFDEHEEALSAAKREFFEELGMELPVTEFIELEPVKQKSGKMVYAWAAEADMDVSNITSNTCMVEYPYKSGKMIEIPEVDRAEWFNIDVAKEKIIPAQVAFIEELTNVVK
jgi:predicted NUDIX family NTP pyrophosphohydrolase